MSKVSILRFLPINAAASIVLISIALSGCSYDWTRDLSYDVPSPNGKQVELKVSEHVHSPGVGPDDPLTIGISIDGRSLTGAEYNYYLSKIYIPGETVVDWDAVNNEGSDKSSAEYTFDNIGDPQTGIRPKS